MDQTPGEMLPEPLGYARNASPLAGGAVAQPSWSALVGSFESQNWLFERTVTGEPAAMAPLTDWLLTSIRVAPAAAPALETVNVWPPTEMYELCCDDEPAIAAGSALTSIRLTFPLKALVVVVELG